MPADTSMLKSITAPEDDRKRAPIKSSDRFRNSYPEYRSAWE